MVFQISTVNLINTLIIAIGIGVCGLSFMQVSTSTHLTTEVRRFFQMFFLLIIIYIATHLARQLMDGLPGQGIRAALFVVTFVEMVSAGFMAYIMSRLVMTVSHADRKVKLIKGILVLLLCAHVLLLAFSQISGLIYRFDENNVYMRSPGYLLSNLCPLIMLVLNVYLLIRYRKNMKKRVRTAFWIYLISPIAAMLIQSFSYGIQFIILATVGSAVYMFEVIIKDQTEQFEKQQMEASRLDTELSMATRIQADMLPNIFPAFPEREEFDIFASMNPAKEVGGYFYDFFLIDDDHLGLVMADVSGKGVPAALFMMASKILVQNYAIMKEDPKAALEAANHQICQSNQEDMFVTVWLGILDLRNGLLTAANAGHEYPVLKMPGGAFELYKDPHGLVVGAMAGLKYKEYEIQLEKGSMIFLYTDGVAEATNANDELFGTDRLLDALNGADNDTPASVLASVDRAVNAFVKDAPQFDDLTMLCVRYNG